MDRGSSSGQATKDTEESDRIHTRTLRAPLRDYLQVWCLSASGCQNHLSSVHACLAKVREPCRCIPAGCEQDIAGFFLKKTQAEGLGRPLAAFGAILVFSPIEGMAPDSDLPFHFDHTSCCIKSHLQVQSLCSGLWFSINCILPRHFDWVSALMVTLLDHYVLVFWHFCCHLKGSLPPQIH